ncbi:MAG: glycosyltransferase [Desulfobacterales bacterium]|nr:glycosyltransferase [Desulfobacterales bacterium]
MKKLQDQKPDELFTYSIVVVDNDYKQSAKNIVADIKTQSLVHIDYYVEPEKNFALVRNKAVQNATGDFVAFIDDDEFPVNTWLLNLYKTHNEYRADGVLGPVKPHFEEEPPKWIIKGKLCERRSFKTGTILQNPKDTRTGNVLLTKKIFNDEDNLFNPDFGRTGGEDVDFFKRMIEKGRKFIWCDEAPVYEIVPPERCKRSYFLRRALLRGLINSKDASLNSILKSVVAFLIYTIMLPFSVLIGQHIFMKYLIKNCDHIGKLLGVFGLKVIKERTF